MAAEPMSGVDAAWLHMDRAENTADVVAVLRLEGRLSASRLRRLVEGRLLAHRRFRQRVVDGALGRPAWRRATISLERHVREVRLGAGAGALDEYVSAVASEPLDLRRPPWRIHLVHLPRGSAIVAKLHHCMADGFALVAVLLSLADEPGGARRRPRARGARGLAALAEPREALRAAARDPRRAAALVRTAAATALALGRMIALRPEPATSLKRPLAGSRRVACSRPLPLPPVRAAARERGVTVHEILAAALAGALHAWLRTCPAGGEPPRDVRALVPVNLRRPGTEEALGNAFGLVFLDLPLAASPADAADAADAADGRVALVHARMHALRGSADALASYAVLSCLGRVPTAVERAVNAFFTAKASLVLTSVPGPRRRLSLAGHRVDHLMFWVPHPASLGLGVSILTYAGEVVIGVRADSAVMPEPAVLVRLFEEGLGAIVPGCATRASGRHLAMRSSGGPPV
jgi:diacylglycerol O-acyltransferase